MSRMSHRDLAELVLLSALWGASFLFMRMGAVEFGPIALAGVRVAGAAAVLLPWMAWRGQTPALRAHAGAILRIGLTNSALPFLCLGYAALHLPGGLSSVFNATTPLWTAVIAWTWLGDAPGRQRSLGLLLGFIGVAGLSWSRLDPAALGASGQGLMPTLSAMGACLLAAALYGYSANFTRLHLQGVPAMAQAAGSQLGAALLLVPMALWQWPEHPPSASAWGSAALLALLCTGLAYVLYFRLVQRVGAGNAVTVTFLIPGFAMGWGHLALGETVDAAMLAACTVVLVGTGLVLKAPAARRG